MSKTTDYEKFERSSVANRRLLRQEELILDVTEALCGAMEEKQMKKSELAIALGKSKGFVSQLLNGGRNLTLRTVADVADALHCRARLLIVPESREHWSKVGEGITIHQVIKGPAQWRVEGIAAQSIPKYGIPETKDGEELAA